jgi:HEPN domain-containing protein
MEIGRKDFQRLADERLEDAQALFVAGRYGCAYYVAGYAVECALKACIAKQTKAESYPPQDTRDYYNHKLDGLLEFAGLRVQMKLDPTDDQQVKEWKEKLGLNWSVVSAWRAQSRYESERYAPQAEKILEAIKDPQYGVLTWLRNRW